MKKIFSALFGLSLMAALPAVALADDGQVTSFAFVVTATDGARVFYPLSTQPKLSHNGTNLVMTTNDATVEYAADAVAKFTLEEVTGPITGITDSAADADVSRRGNLFIFSGLKGASPVEVFDLQGRLLKSVAADESGNASLDISAMPKGVLIIRSSSASLKVMR